MFLVEPLTALQRLRLAGRDYAEAARGGEFVVRDTTGSSSGRLHFRGLLSEADRVFADRQTAQRVVAAVPPQPPIAQAVAVPASNASTSEEAS
jgi:hypothetical protein